MIRQSLTFGIVVVSLVAVTTTHAVDSSTPGKSAAASTIEITGDPIPFPVSNQIVISKGKKKRLLLVTVAVEFLDFDNTPAGTTEYFDVRANGISMEPTGAFGNVVGCTIEASGDCQSQRSYWLDLDNAEANNPGIFVGVPLVIIAERDGAIGTPGCNDPGECPFQRLMLSLTAHMVKK